MLLMSEANQENSPEMKQLFLELMKSTKKAAIEKIIDLLVKKYDGTWRLVGDRPNFATIQSASNPISSIVERTTNAIDAQLEADALVSPKLTENCKSPRLFVEKRYGIPGGYLTSLEDRKGKKEHLVEEAGICMILRDGDTDETPTIEVADKGIGVTRSEIPQTILSLNRDNKINKWYVMGRYGQGGSTTLRFAEYTVIITRRRLPSRELDRQISFTIVKYRESAEGEKDGQYVYLVRKSDNLPFSVSGIDNSFGGGTIVRHVDYDFAKRYLLLDIYGYVETYLFDPVLPFWLVEDRSWVSNPGDRRRMFGARDRLGRTDLVGEKDELVANLNHGDLATLVIRYWLFGRGTQNKEKSTFIDPDEPIVITYLGQTHAKLPRRILSYDCQLPNLYKDLAVQVECDGLTDKGRRTIFTSTREHITEQGRRLIIDSLVNTLSEELSDLDQKRQLEFLSEEVTKAKADIRRKLAEMINRIKPGTFKVSTGGSGTAYIRMKKRARKRIRRNKPPLETKGFPTYIKIANKQDPLKFSKVWIGTWIEVQSDAPDDFLSKFGATLELSKETQKFCRERFKHKDFKGGRLFIKAGLIGDPSVGTTFPFGLKMRASGGTQNYEFEDTRKAEIVKPPPGGGEKKVPLDAPEIVWVAPGDAFWNEEEWTEDNVAEVREKDSVVIYVSLGNKYLTGMLTGSNYTSTKQEILKNKYLLNIAFYAYLQNKGLKELEKGEGTSSAQTQNIPDNFLEKIRHESLEWAAKSILAAITSEQAFSKTEAQTDEVEAD
jgi:hypothetical protein